MGITSYPPRAPETLKQSFFKRNWSQLLSWPLFVIAFGFSIYVWIDSKKEKEPIFLVYPNRYIVYDSSIIDLPLGEYFPLKIFKENDEPISNDLIAVKCYFWNRGEIPVKRDNILSPLRISLDDPKSHILYAKMIKSSRKETGSSIDYESSFHQFVEIDFDILEEGDGIAIQILYEGSSAANIVFDGTIEGVKKVKTSNEIARETLIWESLKLTLQLFLVMVGIVLTGFFVFYIDKFSGKSTLGKNLPPKVMKLISWSFIILIPLILLTGLIFVISEQIEVTKSKSEAKFFEIIPTDLLEE